MHHDCLQAGDHSMRVVVEINHIQTVARLMVKTK